MFTSFSLGLFGCSCKTITWHNSACWI